MEIRKLQIKPEDETRLRELLKIHEADIDSLSDEELDAAEEQTERRLRSLLKKHSQAHPDKSVLRFRTPLKTGTMAFLAAAAVILLVQTQKNETVPNFQNMITKGNSKVTDIYCDISVVGEAVTSNSNQTQYEVAADQQSHLKMYCSDPVFVHVGFLEQGVLHLEMSNLEISTNQIVVMQGKQLVNLTELAAQKSGLRVLVTKEQLTKKDLTEADRQGLWSEEVSLTVKP